MTTAIIGTGGLGSVIARQLAAGGETLRLSSADTESARTLAAQIGRGTVVAADNRDAVQGAGAVVLALRFTVLKGVIDQIADPLAGRLVVVPSNPLSTDAQGNIYRVLPEGQSSGKVVAGWLPAGARLAMVSRSETRSRGVSWGFAAGSVAWLAPSRGGAIAALPVGEVLVRPAGGAGPL